MPALKDLLRTAFLAAVIGFFLLKLSTFGWRFWSGSFMGDDADPALVSSLKLHVNKLAGEIGDRGLHRYDKLNEASRYISESLKSFGYKIEYQHYPVLDKQAGNIIATKFGREKPGEIIIAGAHYDTYYNPGADDNASGVAGLIELAGSFAKIDSVRTIKFIAFVNEEPPFLKTEKMGSMVYAKEARAKKEDIRAAIILESIGYFSNKPNSQKYPPVLGAFYPNKGDYIGIVGNLKYRRLVKNVVSAFRAGNKLPVESMALFDSIPGVDFSDNWSFWEMGYPAVMVTDTAFYRNPNYHKETDLPSELDYDSMAEVVEGVKAALLKLDGENR